MNTLESVSDEQIIAAIDVLEVLPKFNPSKHPGSQVPFLIDVGMVRTHLIKLLEHRRSTGPSARPKIQVRKRPDPWSFRPTWCVIDPEFPNSPLWTPHSWTWQEVLDGALRLAYGRTER